MERVEKTAQYVELPIMVGERAKIALSPNEYALTGKIHEIFMIQYYGGYIYVCFQTKNSEYKNVPVYIQADQSRMFDGEYIKCGDQAMTEKGYTMVGSIARIDLDGITIVDQNGNYQKAGFWDM